MRRGHGRGARARRDPPRPQAREPHGDPRWRGQDPRLRHRAALGNRRGPAHDHRDQPDLRHRGHAPVHGARGAPGRNRGSAHRHLRARRRVLRAAHHAAAVPGLDLRGGGGSGAERGAATGGRAESGRGPRAVEPGDAHAREGPDAALRDLARSDGAARARAPRRGGGGLPGRPRQARARPPSDSARGVDDPRPVRGRGPGRGGAGDHLVAAPASGPAAGSQPGAARARGAWRRRLRLLRARRGRAAGRAAA